MLSSGNYNKWLLVALLCTFYFVFSTWTICEIKTAREVIEIQEQRMQSYQQEVEKLQRDLETAKRDMENITRCVISGEW